MNTFIEYFFPWIMWHVGRTWVELVNGLFSVCDLQSSSCVIVCIELFYFYTELNYRDPYRQAIRDLEDYTSPRKETPKIQR